LAIRTSTGIARPWFHVSRAVPIRLVIVPDPAGRQEDDFFSCADASVPDEQIVHSKFTARVRDIPETVAYALSAAA
jgi:hypothetical protein